MYEILWNKILISLMETMFELRISINRDKTYYKTTKTRLKKIFLLECRDYNDFMNTIIKAARYNYITRIRGMKLVREYKIQIEGTELSLIEAKGLFDEWYEMLSTKENWE